MPDEYMNSTRAMHARQKQTYHSPRPEHSGEEATPVIAPAPAASHSLLRSLLHGSRTSERGNSPVRQAAIQSMQRTHGNRAVQRANSTQSANGTAGRVSVQRSPSVEDSLKVMEQSGSDPAYLAMLRKQMGMEPGQAMHSLETMKKLTGEGSHLDWMARQMGMYGVKDDANGSDAHARQNDAGGYEAGFRAYGHEGEYTSAEVGYGDGKFVAWDEDGGTQLGLAPGPSKVNVGVARGKINQGGFVSVDGEVGTAGYELSAGENGIRAQAGASAAGGSVTIGDIEKENDTDTQFRGGLSAGPSAGVRIHWGDSDKDGRREWGVGGDFGPFSVDFKTENPYLQGPIPWIVDSLSDNGPSYEEQQKNQAEFQAKRDKELAELEKNKEQMMKEQGPEAYYRRMILANAPPQVRNLVQEAAPTQGAAPETMPLTPEDQALEFMTNFHETMAAQRQ